jgi:hypothetical protein
VSTGILVFTKGGRTDNVFFYDVEWDGFSLDDKRDPVPENDLPDCLARWTSAGAGRFGALITVEPADVRKAAKALAQEKIAEVT